MKADIPNKIIISRDDEGVFHHSYWTTEQHLTPFDDTEYIRKDALLEWAKERLHHYAQHDDDAVCWGQRNAFQQVIDKIKSL